MTVEIIVILERALFNNILPCCVPRAEHLLTLLFSCVDCLRTTWPATCSTFYRLTVLGLAVPLIPYCRAPCCVVLHMPFVLAWCRRCCKRQPAPLAWGSQINNNKKRRLCLYNLLSPMQQWTDVLPQQPLPLPPVQRVGRHCLCRRCCCLFP